MPEPKPQEVIELEQKPVEEIVAATTTENEPKEEEGKEVKEEVKPPAKEELSPEDIIQGSKKNTPSGVQKRIDELTRDKYNLKKELQEAQAKLTAPPPKERPLPVAELEFSNSEEFKKARMKYEDDLEQWKEHQRLTHEYEVKQAADFEAKQNKFIIDAERVSSKYPDFMDAINKMPTSMELSAAVLSSDFAPEIGYYLAKNPMVAKQLAMSDIITVGREIGKLEARFGDATKRVVTAAPPPLATTDETGGAADVNDDPSKMSMEQYMEWDKKREMEKIRKKLGG